jgi:hypothetical protein
MKVNTVWHLVKWITTCAHAYLVTQMVISTTAPVTDNDLVVCFRLRLLADDTQQIRLWQCQLGEIFKRGPTICVISKLNQALLRDQVHLKQKYLHLYNNHSYTEINIRVENF